MVKRKNLLGILYISAVLLVCIVPSAGLLVKKSEGTAKENVASDFPALMEDGKLNMEWLSEAGEYFQEHFAFRSEMVNANAEVMSTVAKVSSDDGVVVGTDGWLYYSDSLDDYLGQNLLDERSLFNIAHSMKLMQIYAQMNGMDFLYVPVPNKNTLYGENMPYYYKYKASDERNLERLYEVLAEEGVNFLNLLEPLSEAEEVLYHKTDSHWTNKGASYAADLMMEALGKTVSGISDCSYEVRADCTGDLQEMLYPLSEEKEEEIYYDYEFSYDYVNEITSTFDPKIQTVNENVEGNLIMYRDSFGNALVPFISECFNQVYYSRSVPYPMTDLNIYPADTLIVERAERFLPDTAMNPPVMAGLMLQALPAQTVSVGSYELAVGSEADSELDVSLVQDGMYYRLDGLLNAEDCDVNASVYVRVNGADIYEAFPVTVRGTDGSMNSYGYRLYKPMTEAQEFQVEIFVTDMDAAAEMDIAADVDTAEEMEDQADDMIEEEIPVENADDVIASDDMEAMG